MARNQISQLSGSSIQLNAEISSRELLSSLAVVKSADKDQAVAREDITDHTRTNEQEFFAALVHRKLSQVSRKAQTVFEQEFPRLIKEIKELDSENYLFRAVKGILRLLVRKGLISRTARREIRSYAIGKAQLDNNRTRLSTARLNSEPDDTPVRAVKTALAKFKENEPAGEAELSSFRGQNRKEFSKIRIRSIFGLSP
jgi:hypothetical protein